MLRKKISVVVITKLPKILCEIRFERRITKRHVKRVGIVGHRHQLKVLGCSGFPYKTSVHLLSLNSHHIMLLRISNGNRNIRWEHSCPRRIVAVVRL